MFQFSRSDKYIKEVISPFLPCAKLNDFTTVGFDSDLKLDLNPPVLLKNSQFHRELIHDSYFIHFTSITNLFHIIRSKSLWMKDLNSLSDKSEFEFANKYLDSEHSNNFKSKILSLSLCEFSDVNIKNDYMWKHYASNCKGVCIKLKLHSKRGIPPWYQLGKIIYHPIDKSINDLILLRERHDKFRSENGYAINNLNEVLYASSSLYKSAFYQEECEIRLLKVINHCEIEPYSNSESEPPLQYTYDGEKFGYFMELPINTPNEAIVAPHLSIEEIILGRNISDSEYLKIKDAISDKYFESFGLSTKISIMRN